MNAFVSTAAPDVDATKDHDCLAFISDNQTYDVVTVVAGQYFERPAVRDGSTREALEQLAHAAPRVVIVDFSDAGEPLTDALTLTSAVSETTHIVALGTVNDINLYRELQEAGISDYLVKPVSEKALAVALENLHRPEPDPDHAKPERTQRIVVIGARGGVGASMLSVSMAWMLAEEQQRRTTLVDLDLEFGTVALSLDLEPTHGLREALENPSRLDSLFISSAVAKFNDRLAVLATEETMASDGGFNPSAVEILFDSLARSSDCIVVDLPRAAVGFRARVLKAATQVILVTDLTLAALRDSIRLLSVIKDAAHDVPVFVVANRSGHKDEAMSRSDFQRTLGRKIDFVVPEDRKAIKMAADTGKPMPTVAKSSKAVAVIRDVTRKVSPTKDTKKKAAKSNMNWRPFARKAKDKAKQK